MGRLGLAPDRFEWAMQRLRNGSAVNSEPVLMTHLACADDTDNPTTAAQLQRFGDAIGAWAGDVSIANSAGILGWPDALTERGADSLCRTQLVAARAHALRRVAVPRTGTGRYAGLEPVMTLQARLIDVRASCRPEARLAMAATGRPPATVESGWSTSAMPMAIRGAFPAEH